MVLKQNYLIYIVGLFITIFMLNFLDKNQMQSPNNVTPYLSGAVNLEFGEGWMVNPDDIEKFDSLTPKERIEYQFKPSDDDSLREYKFNAVGFLYIVYFAKKIFFWQGDLEAVKSLQQLLHLTISILILYLLKSNRDRVLFFGLYVINPLVLWYVNFPFYYFWQSIITSILALYTLSNIRVKNYIFLIATLFALIFITRPSTLFIALFTLGYIAYRERLLKIGALAIALFFILSFSMRAESVNEPFHTMYTGVGAYPNSYEVKLDDVASYSKFEEATGEKIVAGVTQNEDIELYQKYVEFIKGEYLNILSQSPLLLLKNAILNTLEAYGFGYKNGDFMILNYLSAGVGLVLITLLLKFREYALFFAIGFSSISFTPYIPPFVGYMFASYILIAIAWIKVGRNIWREDG